MQEVPPLDLPELLAYLVRQSVPLFDQLGISRGMKIHVSFHCIFLNYVLSEDFTLTFTFLVS